MARLHLLRHGETDWNAEQRWQGHSDRPLNELGREQAVAIAPAVAALHPVAIHASDLVRAIDTAGRPRRCAASRCIVDAPLREIDTGSWTGRQRTRDPRGRARRRRPARVAARPPGRAARRSPSSRIRVVEALERVAGDYASHDVVAVFTHGGVIRAAVAHAAGGDWRDARRGGGAADPRQPDRRRRARAGASSASTCRSQAPTRAARRPGRDDERGRPPKGRPRHVESGGDLLSQALSNQVPSALRGLTTLFGRGRGVSPSP